MKRKMKALMFASILLIMVGVAGAQEGNPPGNKKPGFDVDGLPDLAEGFEASILAHEPAFFHISALAFGKQGRLYVGGGPQYRDPKPDTPKDSVWVVIDKNQDGKAETVKEFATGFNSVQSLAWRDGKLWIANAPDLTYVEDTDDDLKADKYVKVFTNLGHLRHGLHGLVWAPDGRLYMTQGNSTVQQGAPEAFRKLQGVNTENPVEQPVNKVYSPGEYEADYIGEWPSSEGGMLRMEPDGENLEIFARGMRNPWDWTFGPGFNWLADDQDPGNFGDRVFMPFEGAYFGMYHPVVGFDWMGKDPRVPPASYHFTRYKSNSLVGIVYYLHDHFPEKYRNIFFINDWANNKMYTFRPKWDGANLKDTGGMKENFADGGDNQGGELSYTPKPDKPLFRPTDLTVGPGGALFVAGWGDQYGSKYDDFADEGNTDRHFGRIFRIRHSERPLTPRDEWFTAKRTNPYGKWTFEQLIADLGSQVRTWRTDAQLELVRRGEASREPLLEAIQSGNLSQMAETYAIWALGRIGPDVDLFRRLASGNGGVRQNLRIQAIRILGDRGITDAADVVAGQLADPNPRVRKAAALNIDDIGGAKHLAPLAAAVQGEQDQTVFYAQWKAMRALGSKNDLVDLLRESDSINVQGGALFALNETPDAICSSIAMSEGGLPGVRKILQKKFRNHCQVSISPESKRFEGKLEVKIDGPKEGNGLKIRYATNQKLTSDSPVYGGDIEIDRDTRLRAALYSDGKRIGPVHETRYDAVSDDTWDMLVVSDLKASNEKDYRVRTAAFSPGEKLYIDRDYTYETVPGELRGATYIQTANDDADVRAEPHLQFKVNKPATVYLALDSRANQLPDWVDELGFSKAGYEIDTTDTSFRIYGKKVSQGTVQLGGNAGAGHSNYQVIITSNAP